RCCSASCIPYSRRIPDPEAEKWVSGMAVRRKAITLYAKSPGGGLVPRAAGRSVIAPQPRGRQFQEVPVGIAEIDTAAAPPPIGAALDRNAAVAQPLLPGHEFVGGDGKGNVHRSAAIVRRDSTARHRHGFERGAT